MFVTRKSLGKSKTDSKDKGKKVINEQELGRKNFSNQFQGFEVKDLLETKEEVNHVNSNSGLHVAM